jgi:hypothetical protein
MSWPKAVPRRILRRARALRRPRSKIFTVAGWVSKAVDMIVVRMAAIHMGPMNDSDFRVNP